MLSLGPPRGGLFGLSGSDVAALSTLAGSRVGLVPEEGAIHLLPASSQGSSPREDPGAGPDQGLTCNTCGIGSTTAKFESKAEQRLHFQSDWHRLNVRRRLASKAPLSEEAFDTLIEQADEVSSISGSGTDSDEDAGRRNTNVKEGHATAGLSCFRCSDGALLAVWRALIEPPAQKRTLSPEQLLANLQQLHMQRGTWVIILCRGGHFAAAVFDTGAPARPGQHAKRDAPAFTALHHKTFHRYVIRAKSGGRQSAKDSGGKPAKSGGSSIRRHNEAMLREEIQALLLEWRSHLTAASLIFVAAPGMNSTPLYSTEPRVLDRHDPRVRSIPFNTRRPTFSETQKVVRTLLTVYAVEQSAVPPPVQEAPRLTSRPEPEQQQAEVPADGPATSGHGAAELQPAQPPHPPVPDSDLHVATKEGDVPRITQLLEAGSNPTVLDSQGVTPYAAASTKAARDAFRRHMAGNPEQWDWSAAGVPSALTPELEAHQAAKQAEKKARQRERDKERKRLAAQSKAEQDERARAAAQAEIEAAAAEAAALSVRQRGDGKPSKVKAQAAKAQSQAQTRREQLAAAAEARMAALQEAASQQKLW